MHNKRRCFQSLGVIHKPRGQLVEGASQTTPLLHMIYVQGLFKELCKLDASGRKNSSR